MTLEVTRPILTCVQVMKLKCICTAICIRKYLKFSCLSPRYCSIVKFVYPLGYYAYMCAVLAKVWYVLWGSLSCVSWSCVIERNVGIRAP